MATLAENGRDNVELSDDDLAAEEFDLEAIEEDLQRFRKDDKVKDALGQGVDLRQYARQIDADLRALQSGSIPGFIEEAPTSAELYEQLTECDGILESMETILQGFQSDLGGISDEIKHLQDESLSMNVKLKNRRDVEKELFTVLKNVVVSDELIVGICQGEVNESYLRHVEELDEKVEYIRRTEASESHGVPPCDILAVSQVEPQLDRLRLKAVGKARVFLLEHIAALKKPKTNVQIMQQNVLLKFKKLMEFLSNHAPAVAEEVKSTYVDTMSRILHNIFKTYFASLLKLQRQGPGSEDVVAADQAVLPTVQKNPSSLFSQPGSSESAAAKLAARERLLGEPDEPPIIIHVAKGSNKTFHFEAIFRSVQKHLMDSATSEFLFILDFFSATKTDMFNQVFARTLSLCLEHIENYLYTCNDIVALLLMIRVSQAHRLMMERRHVPCLDGYFDHVNMMLWPQFKKAFDANVRSLIRPTLSKLGAQNLNLQAHYISRRYGELASTVHALSTSLSASDEMLPLNLAKLRQAYYSLLDTLVAEALQSRQHHRALDSAKGKLIFRINNLYQVLDIMCKGALAEDITFLEDALANDNTAYIEEELKQVFPSMIALVHRVEGDGEEASVDDGELNKVNEEFVANWKSSMQVLSSSVSNYFPSKVDARETLKQVLAQLVLYYTRFVDIAKAHGSTTTQAQLVTIPEIMAEMKTFGRNT